MKRYLPVLLSLMMWFTALAAVSVEVANASELTYNVPTLENGWENFSSEYIGAGYAKDCSGFVHIRGIIKGGSTTSRAFVLPEGDRPEKTEQHLLLGEGNTVATSEITPSGDVRLYYASGSITTIATDFYVGPITCEYGVEGKEGKEGPEGKEGKEGKEGLEGHEGKEGVSGEGGGGKVELVSFGNEAQNTLSELKETDETIGWCVIGTLLALALGFMVYKILGPGRR